MVLGACRPAERVERVPQRQTQELDAVGARPAEDERAEVAGRRGVLRKGDLAQVRCIVVSRIGGVQPRQMRAIIAASSSVANYYRL